MKTLCILVSGTNGVGKTTLAKAYIERFGGIARIEGQATYTVAGPALAGIYGVPSGGCDRLKDAAGRTASSVLASVVEEALRQTDLVLCEGSRLDTFGLSLVTAIFKAERQLVVNLFAPHEVIRSRLVSRTGDRNRNWTKIFAKQRQAARSAEKFCSIGVPVMRFDTSRTECGLVLARILEFREQLQ